MTREEAIEIIKREFAMDEDVEKLYPEVVEARDMAISALEQTETWNGYHGQITAPKGTFKKIWDDCEQEPCDTSTDEPMTMVYPTIFCDDAISRAELIGILKGKVKTQRSTIEIADKLIPLINELPSVTPSRQVIEDIKADIEAARYGLINDGLDVALQIIDKHTEGR